MVRFFFRTPRDNHVARGYSRGLRSPSTGHNLGEIGIVLEPHTRPYHVRMLSHEAGMNLFNSPLNAHLALDALTYDPLAYQCWLRGKYVRIVTYDGWMKLSSSLLT